MTKKCFIKLLMSIGYDRNGANEYANVVKEAHWFDSYSETLKRTIHNLCISKEI